MQPTTILLLRFILSTRQVQASAASGVGFCLDQVPPSLAGTGYTAISTLTKAQCPRDSWCPLLNETKVFDFTDNTTGSTAQVEYYWWSACCTGRQGRSLIADEVAGLPTCESNQSALACERMQWQEKFEADFLGGDYNFNVAPARTVTDPRIYGGVASDKVQCTCKASDPECEQPGTGDNCLVCRTDSPCGSKTAVQLSVSFFKITSVDLLTSQLDASVWIRQIWSDPRLSYDYQCYGGLDSFEVQASPGDMENTRIWTPDVELYNHKTSIWGGSVLGSRLAIVYSCWDGAPSRGGCGEIFFSRPGVVTALCKYQGLIMFPRDALSCELEFSSWALDGRHQDLVKRQKDGGVNWAGSGKGLAGLTAGSTFQDYTIQNLEVTRKVSFYDCCPNSPYPTLLYQIDFRRATAYYTFKLVVPSIVLSMLSFITFYMNPETGERLGFGITMILAMLALDITAASMMPVCSEKTFMDFLSGVCMLFGCVSMLETGFVMFLYHQQADNWKDALSRRSLEKFGWDTVHTVGGRGTYENERAIIGIFNRFGHVMRVDIKHQVETTGNLSCALVTMGRAASVLKIVRAAESEGIMAGSTRLEVSRFEPDEHTTNTDSMRHMFEGHTSTEQNMDEYQKKLVLLDGSDNLKLRHQMYSQIFFVLDIDFSGSLNVDEICIFGEYELGVQWDRSLAVGFFIKYDTDKNMELGLDEFALFCEEICYNDKTIEYIQQRLKGFLSVVDRKEKTRQGMWHHRAHRVDVIARWTIPPGFIGFLIMLFNISEEDLHNLAANRWEGVFYLSGLLPTIATCVAMVFLGIYTCHRGIRQEGNARLAETASSAPDTPSTITASSGVATPQTQSTHDQHPAGTPRGKVPQSGTASLSEEKPDASRSHGLRP